LASLNILDCTNRGRDERQEILEGVACTTEHDDSKLALGEVLLELKISISGDEDGKARRFGRVEQRPVLEARPGLLLDGSNLVPCQNGRELSRELLIEQDAHARLPLHGLLRELQRPALSTP
jgi:hypothetical protein